MTTLAYVALHDRMADAIDAELGAAIAGLGADGESVRDAVGVLVGHQRMKYPLSVLPLLVHGAETTAGIEAASAALFSGGSLADADPDVLRQALETARPLVTGGVDRSLTDLFVESGLVSSRGEARRAFAEGGAYVNNERAEDPDYVPTSADYLGGKVLVLRRGKKNFAGVAAP